MANPLSGSTGPKGASWSLGKDFKATIKIKDASGRERTLEVKIIAKDKDGNVMTELPETVKVHELAEEYLRPLVQQLQESNPDAMLAKMDAKGTVDVWPSELPTDIPLSSPNLLEVHRTRLLSPDAPSQFKMEGNEDRICHNEEMRIRSLTQCHGVKNAIGQICQTNETDPLPADLTIPENLKRAIEEKKTGSNTWAQAFVEAMEETPDLQTAFSRSLQLEPGKNAKGVINQEMLHYKAVIRHQNPRAPEAQVDQEVFKRKCAVYINLYTNIISDDIQKVFSESTEGDQTESSISKKDFMKAASFHGADPSLLNKYSSKTSTDKMSKGELHEFMRSLAASRLREMNTQGYALLKEQVSRLKDARIDVEQNPEALFDTSNRGMITYALMAGKIEHLNQEFATVKKLWQQLVKVEEPKSSGTPPASLGLRISSQGGPHAMPPSPAASGSSRKPQPPGQGRTSHPFSHTTPPGRRPSAHGSSRHQSPTHRPTSSHVDSRRAGGGPRSAYLQTQPPGSRPARGRAQSLGRPPGKPGEGDGP